MPPLFADVSIDVIFFLVAAVIALVHKLYEKSKALRESSERKMRARERREHLDLVRTGGEVTEAPRPVEPRPGPAIVVRPLRDRASRPPPRTERAPVVVTPARRRRPQVATQAPAPGLLARLGRDPDALREAVLLREVLGPPVAMRGFRFPRR